jgi:MFS family permease
MKSAGSPPEPGRWYGGITRYQWLVLLLASAGWVFDVFEGQIYTITRGQLLGDILPPDSSEDDVKFWGDLFLGVFLAGGALGGIAFGALADRWGRRPTLIVTIVTYSVFSGLTYFASTLWQVGVLRFLVAAGVGGEWAVAAALVAEVFPAHARAQAASIFHASSIIGTWLAGLAGLAVAAQWRYAYLLGVLPALLIVAVRIAVVEPQQWVHARGAGPGTAPASAKRKRAGSLGELLGHTLWRKRALPGLLLAAVGLGTFWGITVAGQDLARALLVREGESLEQATEQAKLAYGIVETAGGGLGLLAFGPLSVRWGRRRTFVAMQLAALVIVPVTCYAPAAYWQFLALLPLFGFCTLGMHAGFAVYFPELFPTHLRATGASFCFNGGRVVASPLMVLSGWLKALPGMDLRLAVSLLGGLFLLGVLVVCFLPETKGEPLPE